MRVLIIDTETTGLDPKSDHVIEVGAIVYSVEHGCSLVSYSSLLAAPGNAAEAINRIPAAALSYTVHSDPWSIVLEMARQCEVLLAHNAEFDRAFVPAELAAMEWVCTRSDIAWPKQTKPGSSLVSLALEHDLGVAYAHRALTDCDLIARLLTAARKLGSDVGAMIERGRRPKATFAALVSYERREEAKAAGFAWDSGRKIWHRRMPIEDAAALPFRTRQVAP